MNKCALTCAVYRLVALIIAVILAVAELILCDAYVVRVAVELGELAARMVSRAVGRRPRTAGDEESGGSRGRGCGRGAGGGRGWCGAADGAADADADCLVVTAASEDGEARVVVGRALRSDLVRSSLREAGRRG